MKKIYLLFLLTLLSIRGFSLNYYTFHTGAIDSLQNWNSTPGSGGGAAPLSFCNAGDTFWVDRPMIISGGHTWTVSGTVIFRFSHLTDTGTLPCTLNIGRGLVAINDPTIDEIAITSLPGAGDLTINLSGNLKIAGAARFIPQAPTYFHLNFIQPFVPYCRLVTIPNATLTNPDLLSWTSTGRSSRMGITINSVVQLTSDVPLPDSADVAEELVDTLVCGTFRMISRDTSDAFAIDPFATIYTANTGGLDSSIQNMTSENFSGAANYIYNGVAPQVTGFTLPTAFIYLSGLEGGTLTVDNPTGATLSQATSFAAQTAVDLELGMFTIGSMLTMNTSVVNVDSGNFSSGPTYTANIVVNYVNLGYNALATNTGNELLPAVPLVARQIIEIDVNKPGATITLASSPVTNAILLSAGTLDASVSNYNITGITDSWVNISGPTAFVPRLGSVNFAKSPVSSFCPITGSSTTTFNNVVIDDSTGVTLGIDEIINGTLTLDTGNVYIYNHNLIFGTAATAVAGTPSATSMIVADSTGQVEKGMSADGIFLYPVGDSINYSPITLAFSGSGAYGAGAFAGVNLRNRKEPHNTDTANYLNRYWTITTSGITTPSYIATGTYVTGDVVGTEGDISAAAYNGALPWLKYGITSVATHTLTSGIIDTSVNFTGVDSTGPTVVVSDDTVLCMPGGFDTLRVLAATGDTPYSYSWSPAAGLSATTGAVVAVTPTVTTTYTVTVTDGNGSTGFDTVRVTVNAAPTLDSASNSGPVCSGNTLNLIGYNPQNVTGYLWQGPAVITDSTLDTGMVVSAFTTATGTYMVTVVDGIGSGCTAFYTTTATVDTFPDSTHVTGGGIFCDSTTIFATNAGPGRTFFQDTVSGGEDTTILATSALITMLGTHTYYFNTLSSLGCWGAQGSATVTINALPLPDTAAGAGTFCDSAVISASNGDSGTIYFQGRVAGGTSTTLGGTPHTVTASGTYYFRAQSAAGCWGQQDSVTVVINPTPTPVTASGAGTFCGSDSISATGGIGGIIYYQLNTPNGMDSLLGDSQQVVTTSGTYYFRAEALGCWSQQDSVVVTVHPLPATVMITPAVATAFCDSTTIFATNGGDGTIYFQDTISGGTSTAIPDSIAFINRVGAFNYHFRAENTVTGCWSLDDSVQITIDSLPTAPTASGSGGPFCGSTIITADNGSDGIIYFEGTAPGGTDLSIPSVSQTVTATGTYYFRAQDPGTGCWSREGISDDSATVHINPLPGMHNVTGTGAFCQGSPGLDIALDGSDTGIHYQLYNGTDTTGSILTGTGSPLDFGIDTVAGTFSVIAIDTTTGCNDTTVTSATITVNPLPVVYMLSGGGAFCFGGTGSDLSLSQADNFVNYQVYDNGVLETTAAGDGSGFTFDLGDFTDTGTYYVIAVTAPGCTSTMLDSVRITTIPLPTLYTVSGGGTLCAGDTGFHVFLSGADTGTNYQLYNGAGPVGLSQTGAGLPLDFGLQTTDGVYTVIATNPVTTCVNMMTGSATITVNPLPDFESITGGGGYCNGTGGLPVGLSGSDAGVSYQLFHSGALDGTAVTGTGSGFNFPNQTLAGSYTVIATNPGTGCVLAIPGSTTITINALPTVYTIFGGGGYCAGGTGFNVGITGSDIGISYQLFNDGVMTGTAISGTGGIDSFGHQAAGGTYTVVATNPLTSCTSNIAGSVAIIVNALPAIDTVTGGGVYCAGSAGQHIDLSGSSIGIDYQLYKDGVSVGGAIPGTISSLDFGSFTAAGAYSVIAMNVVTGCTSDMRDTVNISINPVPNVYSITGGGSYCAGSAGVDLGISGSDLGINYQLFYGTGAYSSPIVGTGGAINFGLYTLAGEYTIEAMNPATTCRDSMAGSETININPLPPQHLVLGGGTYCTGGAGVDVKLSRSDAGYIYLLYDGSTTVSAPLAGTDTVLDFGVQTLGGTYTVMAIDTATTCSDSMLGSAVIVVDAPLLPVVSIAASPGISVGVGERDTLTATVTGAGAAPTYQWYVNGNLVPGATNAVFAFNIFYNTDSITCQVTSHGTCGGYTSSASIFITLHNVGVQQVTMGSSDVKLVPNPNKGIFTLKGTLGTSADEAAFVEITDMLGQVVYKNKVMTTGGIINEQIELNSTLANGMYILNLRSGDQHSIFHFVIEQ